MNRKCSVRAQMDLRAFAVTHLRNAKREKLMFARSTHHKNLPGFNTGLVHIY